MMEPGNLYYQMHMAKLNSVPRKITRNSSKKFKYMPSSEIQSVVGKYIAGRNPSKEMLDLDENHFKQVALKENKDNL